MNKRWRLHKGPQAALGEPDAHLQCSDLFSHCCSVALAACFAATSLPQPSILNSSAVEPPMKGFAKPGTGTNLSCHTSTWLRILPESL